MRLRLIDMLVMDPITEEMEEERLLVYYSSNQAMSAFGNSSMLGECYQIKYYCKDSAYWGISVCPKGT